MKNRNQILKNIIIKLFLPGIISILFLLSPGCKQSTIEPDPIDYNFFPLKLKSWIIYDVTIRLVDAPSGQDSIRNFQLKEIIDTTYIDDANRLNYRIERYTRDDSTKSWVIADIWSACITNFSAIKTEENISYVKINFPVYKNNSWNGNAYNSLDPKTYKISDLNKTETINGKKIDSVMTVLQDNQINAIEKIYAFEKYAKHIGLVQKQMINISAEASNNIPIENRIKIASFYYQNIRTWGN